MSHTKKSPGQIATSSVEEGLDFACSLLSDAIDSLGNAHPEKAPEVLSDLTHYVRLRYVGELLLALEYLASLGRKCALDESRHRQIWSQLQWVAREMRLTPEERKRLEMPND
jgi:hypothetical protein